MEELPYMVMLNSTLPEDIRVLAWAPVGRDFSARFNCLHRTYKYFFPKGSMNIDVSCTVRKDKPNYNQALMCIISDDERSITEIGWRT